MQYSIHLKGKNDDWYQLEEALLPFIPEHVFDAMLVSVVDEMGLCKHCEMDCKCHILEPIPHKPHTYRKLCTVLFHDTVQPSWRLEDVV